MPVKSLTLISILLITMFGLVFISCQDDRSEYTITFEPNPYVIAPLTAELQIETKLPSRISVEVTGASPIERSFDSIANSHTIPVLGLYPDKLNKVAVTIHYTDGNVVDTVEIQTKPLPDVFPEIEINKVDRSKMELGLHACDIHFANHGKFRSIPFIFDDQGAVRWYLDLSPYGAMLAPFQRLSDGHLLMVSRHQLHEFNMMGEIVGFGEIDNNYGMHHDVVEIPGDRLLICIGRRDARIKLGNELVVSDSDFIMLYNRKKGQIIKIWDLAKLLDVSRDDLNFFRRGDWLHMNGLAFDPLDGSIIVSAKNQGLIKISWNNQLHWIMSPHKNWGKAGRDGRGKDTRPFLLTALDEEGKPYSNEIQLGNKSAENFDFPWGPHAPKYMPNGNIMVFDNGTYRNFNDQNRYSRAVEYKIDEENRTVQQVWQYGKERGEDFYSSIVSDVDYFMGTKNVLITSGYLHPRGRHSAKIVEVDYLTGEEVFEATLYLKTLNGDKTVGGWGQTDILYRSDRMQLSY